MWALMTSDFAKNLYSDAIRHGLIALAGILATRGYLHQGDVANFVAAGTAIAMAWGWQIFENLAQAETTTQLKTTNATLQTQAAQVVAVAQSASTSPINEVAQLGMSMLGSLMQAAPGSTAATAALQSIATPPVPPKK